MNLSTFLEFGRNNPALVAASGAGGGLAAWLIAHAETFILLFQLVGGFFGCLLAVVSFVFVLPKLIRFAARAWRHGLTGADKE